MPALRWKNIDSCPKEQETIYIVGCFGDDNICYGIFTALYIPVLKNWSTKTKAGYSNIYNQPTHWLYETTEDI